MKNLNELSLEELEEYVSRQKHYRQFDKEINTYKKIKGMMEIEESFREYVEGEEKPKKKYQALLKTGASREEQVRRAIEYEQKHGVAFCEAWDKVNTTTRCGMDYHMRKQILGQEPPRAYKKKRKIKNKRIDWEDVVQKSLPLITKKEKKVAQVVGKILKRRQRNLSLEEKHKFAKALHKIPGYKVWKDGWLWKVKKTDTQPDARTKRMRFMSQRANSLMRTYNYSREQAFQMASDEWNKGRPKKQFPKFMTVAVNEKILKSVIENVIDKVGELKFNTDGYTIGIWKQPQWKLFLIEFMEKANKICEYFNCAGKFVIDQESQTIIYRK